MPSIVNRVKSLPGLTGLRLLGKVLSLPRPLVLLGPDSAIRLCGTMADQGFQRVLIVTDEVLHKLGVVDPLQAALTARGVSCFVFAEVTPDPTFDVVDAGLRMLKAVNADALLVVGGGSAIDAAKVMSLAATTGKNPRDLVGVLKGRKPGLPMFVVPSTSGTGSEVSVAAVISDSITHQKSLVIDTNLVPVAAALDPVINAGMPASVTAETGVDALTHCLEGWLSEFSNAETDGYNQAAVRLILNNLATACAEPKNLAAREAMALGSHYAGLCLSTTAVGNVHAIAHQLGGHYRIPHGRANAMVLPHVLRFYLPHCKKRLGLLARKIGLAAAGSSDLQAAQQLVDTVCDLIESLPMKRSGEFIQTTDFPDMVKAALTEVHGLYAVPLYLSESDTYGLLHAIQQVR